MKEYPKLTVFCAGYRWKAHVHIHVLMMDRTVEDIRTFVKLYLRPMLDHEKRREVVNQIMDWFSSATAVAQENWAKASQDYVDGYKTSSEYPFQPSRKQAAENKRLFVKLEKSKRAVEKLKQRRKAFVDECAVRRVSIPVEISLE